MAMALRCLGVARTLVPLKNCRGEFFIPAPSFPSHLSKSIELFVTKGPTSFSQLSKSDTSKLVSNSGLIGNSAPVNRRPLGLNTLQTTCNRVSMFTVRKFHSTLRARPFEVHKRWCVATPTPAELAEAKAQRIAKEELKLENERRQWLQTVFLDTKLGRLTIKIMSPFMKFSKIHDICSTHPELTHLVKGVNTIIAGLKFIGCGVAFYLGSWGKEVVDDFRKRMKEEDDRALSPSEKDEVEQLKQLLAERDQRIRVLEGEAIALKMQVAIGLWKHCVYTDWSGGLALGPEDLHIWEFMNHSAKE